MADQRIIGKSAQLQGQPVTTSEPTRTGVISREPGIEPATTEVQRAGDLHAAVAGDPAPRSSQILTPPEETATPGQLRTKGIQAEALTEDCQPLSGRARSPTTTGTRAVQLLCRVYNQNVPPATTIDALDTEVINGVSQRLREPRLWSLRTFGEDNMTSPNVGTGGTWPQPRVAGFATNATAFSARSWLHARVRWEAPGTHGTFDMDLGGPPIEIYANHVQINILAPALHQEILEGTVNPWVTGATTLNCWTDAYLEILPIESSQGRNATTLTMRQEALANTQIGFEIPAFAKRVTVYQSGAGAASAQWTWEIGSFGAATSSVEVGTLPFIAGLRRTNQIDVVPGATYIMSDIDQNNARLFTAVWEIEP